MLISDLLSVIGKPAIYERGSALMWENEYISKQLLPIHLNPEIDLASRDAVKIENTLKWIQTKTPPKKMKILDLGCGPGLYTRELSKQGHDVTGVDISKASIEHALKDKQFNKQKIQYIHANYLEVDLEEKAYDLVIMIYTDFGVLLPDERILLLQKIKRWLKPGGLFIFDVLSTKDLHQKISTKDWEMLPKGFWSDKPYLALSESYLYEKENVILYQHIVLENEKMETYRFWTQYFEEKLLKKLMEETGLRIQEISDKVLPSDDIWSGGHVMFCICEKM